MTALRESIELEGVVLRQYECGADDMKLCLFTDRLGKIMVYAKGIKSSKNKNHGPTLTFCYSDFQIITTKDGGYQLCSAHTKQYFMSVAQSVEAVALASYFCQCISCTFPEKNPDINALSLLLNSLYALSVPGFRPLSQIKGSFEFMLCKILGFCPDLFECAVCGNDKEEKKDYVFSFEACGLVCNDCAKENDLLLQTRAFYLSYPVVCALRFVALANTKKFLSFNLQEQNLEEFENFCERYFLSVADYRFDTLLYYKSLKRSYEPYN